MNVHHAIRENAEEFAFQNPHETGEHDQIDVRILKCVDEGAFGIVIQLGAKFSGSNEFGAQATFARSLQDSGLGYIAEDDCDLSRDFSVGARISDRDEV